MRSEAEIKDKLECLRKLLAESEKNPVKSIQDRTNEKYSEAFEKRKEQIGDELAWMREMAILEWVLKEEQHYRTTWMIEARL